MIFKVDSYKKLIDNRLNVWKNQKFLSRLWEKDPTLWFPGSVPEIENRLGWLDLPQSMQNKIEDDVSFSKEIREEGITHVVLLGMGGSSLAPEVFQETFGNLSGYPELMILDSTHPEAILSVENKLDFKATHFLVSSKSGTTIETLSLFRYFWHKVSLADQRPGHRFSAISDSGSPLSKLAKERGFRRLFEAPSDVGGRYSALSPFGLVPAALIGMEVQKLLDHGRIAANNNSISVSEPESSALVLGAFLGEIAKSRDKLTIFTSPSLSGFPVWLEQLIAESTGKDGRGIIPVPGEPVKPADFYRRDRIFVFFIFERDRNENFEKFIKEIDLAGHPLLRIDIKDLFELGQQMFIWEAGVAAAGSILEIHPFNQPDVQLSKNLTRQFMSNKTDKASEPVKVEKAISIEDKNALNHAINSWISSFREGDYVAIQAFLPPNQKINSGLQELRSRILDRMKTAATFGYGPRFLHSTGQLHKGGPSNGLFLQLIDECDEYMPVPETDYSFRTLIQAQADGDYLALKQRKRQVIRVNLGQDSAGALKELIMRIPDF